jgi:hypothetical protein
LAFLNAGGLDTKVELFAQHFEIMAMSRVFRKLTWMVLID